MDASVYKAAETLEQVAVEMSQVCGQKQKWNLFLFLAMFHKCGELRIHLTFSVCRKQTHGLVMWATRTNKYGGGRLELHSHKNNRLTG